VNKTPPGERHPLPDDFPVTWDPPEHEDMHWFWDQMHHPHAVTPMTSSIDGVAFAEGIGRAFATMHMPIGTQMGRAFNYYFYFGGVQRKESAEEAEAREKLMQAEMMQRAPRCLKDWNEVYLPEVMQLNDRLRSYPYADATTAEIADLLDEAIASRKREWELHFLAVLPAMGSAMEFARIYEEAFGPSPAGEHYRMLQGYPNKSVEAGQALYDIAQDLRSNAEIASLIAETPAADLFSKLEQSAEGKVAANRLRTYLNDYGWRSDQFEFADPSWLEDPAPMIHNLRAYMRDDAIDPSVEQSRAATERERLVKEMLERADGDAAKRNTLQMMVTVAQQYLPVQENHNFYIDQMNTVLMRKPILEAGRRLAAEGALNEPSDAFLLTITEAQNALTKPAASWATLAAQRKSEMAHWAKIIPPRFVGTQAPVDPRSDVTDRFWGLDREASKEPRVITGHPASQGVVIAPAKVVRSLSEADKIEAGDILVCEMTMPPWTPLFSTVSAVVADSGGVLSHCAIVAREYRIPCVVGTVDGTRRIKDGQTLTVDGGRGIVRIED
jgi:phosphohistidine swiveling domain-containing protein